jgi:hypothetical protein
MSLVMSAPPPTLTDRLLYVVTVGDSSISGEAGRWAGSSNNSEAPADSLGTDAYPHDSAGTAGTAGSIPWCHRRLPR